MLTSDFTVVWTLPDINRVVDVTSPGSLLRALARGEAPPVVIASSDVLAYARLARARLPAALLADMVADPWAALMAPEEAESVITPRRGATGDGGRHHARPDPGLRPAGSSRVWRAAPPGSLAHVAPLFACLPGPVAGALLAHGLLHDLPHGHRAALPMAAYLAGRAGVGQAREARFAPMALVEAVRLRRPVATLLPWLAKHPRRGLYMTAPALARPWGLRPVVERDALEDALVAQRLRAVGTRLSSRPGRTDPGKAVRLREGVWLDFYHWIDDGVRLKPSGWETWQGRLNRLGFGLPDPAMPRPGSQANGVVTLETQARGGCPSRSSRPSPRIGRRMGEATLRAIARADDGARPALVARRLGVPHLERDLVDAMHKRSRESARTPEGVVTPEAQARWKEGVVTPEAQARGKEGVVTPEARAKGKRVAARDAAWLADLRAIVETDPRWSGRRARLVVEIDEIAKHIDRARDIRYGPARNTPVKI